MQTRILVFSALFSAWIAVGAAAAGGRSSIFSRTSSLPVRSSIPPQSLLRSGPLLLNPNTTLDRLSFIESHDSHTSINLSSEVLGDAALKSLTAFAVDQTRTVTQQLNDGVRVLRFDAVNLTLNGTFGQYEGVYMVHGSYIEGFACKVFLGVDMQVVFQPTIAYLLEVRDFLVNNPEAVVFLLDEGDAGPDIMAPLYQEAFGGIIDFYVTETPLPTYQHLLDTNQRIIIFSSDDRVPSPSYPWINAMWYSAPLSQGFIMQAPYSYYTPSDVRFLPNETGQHGDAGNGDIGAPLYLFNHFFYSDGFPIWRAKYGDLVVDVIKMFSSEFDFSDPTKNHWSVGEQLRADVCTAWGPAGANRRPNFISVDFEQGVNGTKSIAVDLVNEMNQSDAPPCSWVTQK